MASWTTDDTDALARCGHCDNCTRPPETVDQKDVTVEAWQILKIVAAVERQGGRLTLNGLSDLARGAGGGAFDAGGKGKGKAKEKTTLDLDEVAGGKITFSKDVSGFTASIIFFYLMIAYLWVLEPGHGNALGRAAPFSLSERIVFLKLICRQCLRCPRAAGHTTRPILSRRSGEQQRPSSRMLFS